MTNQNKKMYTINLTLEEANSVLGALGELPAKVSMMLIQNIQYQCSQQEQKPETHSHED
jgi:hypothetical protein